MRPDISNKLKERGEGSRSAAQTHFKTISRVSLCDNLLLSSLYTPPLKFTPPNHRCRGPHIRNTREIKAFAVLSASQVGLCTILKFPFIWTCTSHNRVVCSPLVWNLHYVSLGLCFAAYQMYHYDIEVCYSSCVSLLGVL